jgi:hypothetical protein
MTMTRALKILAIAVALAAVAPIATPTAADAWRCSTWGGTCNKPAAAWPKNMLGVWCGGGEENDRGVILYGGCDGFFKDEAIIIEPRSYRTPRLASGGASVCTYDRLEVSTGNYRGRIEFAFTARCKDSELPKCRWTERATGWAFVTPEKSMEIKWTQLFDESNECNPD